MSSLNQWIIVILLQIVLNLNCVFSGGDDGEHVHIKVHIPEVKRKHTHFHKVQKHIFHPKKVLKASEYLDDSSETIHQSLNMMPYEMSGHSMQFPSFPLSIGNLPDIPTYSMDNTLEASIIKKPKMNSMSHMISEDMFSKFHGMKRPSEFLGARPVAEMQRFISPSEEENDDEAVSDDYDAGSTESMIMDQRVAGSIYPEAMTIETALRSKWPAPTYSNVYESAAKPYMKWPSWLTATTDDDYISPHERLPSSTTMQISKARPLSSSRQKYEQQSYNRRPYSEAWVVPKKKKSKTSKRKRAHSPGFRIEY